MRSAEEEELAPRVLALLDDALERELVFLRVRVGAGFAERDLRDGFVGGRERLSEADAFTRPMVRDDR